MVLLQRTGHVWSCWWPVHDLSSCREMSGHFFGTRCCSSSSLVETVHSLWMGWGKGLTSHIWPWQCTFWEDRIDGMNREGCKRSYLRLPAEDVLFPSPPLPTSSSKSSNMALCGSLRYRFQGSMQFLDDVTFHKLRHPKYNLIAFSLLAGAGRASGPCLLILCEMVQCPSMQTNLTSLIVKIFC